MAIEDLKPLEAIQWAPSGNGLDGRPGEVMAFLATDEGRTHGYGYGPGWAMDFGSQQGQIRVLPTQWIVRLSNGVLVVEDERPEDAHVFDAEQRLEELKIMRELRERSRREGCW